MSNGYHKTPHHFHTPGINNHYNDGNEMMVMTMMVMMVIMVIEADRFPMFRAFEYTGTVGGRPNLLSVT